MTRARLWWALSVVCVAWVVGSLLRPGEFLGVTVGAVIGICLILTIAMAGGER